MMISHVRTQVTLITKTKKEILKKQMNKTLKKITKRQMKSLMQVAKAKKRHLKKTMELKKKMKMIKGMNLIHLMQVKTLMKLTRAEMTKIKIALKQLEKKPLMALKKLMKKHKMIQIIITKEVNHNQTIKMDLKKTEIKAQKEKIQMRNLRNENTAL